MSKDIARDHHYLPQFYLREFCNSDGQVTRTFRGPDDRLYERPFTPKKVGYQRDLYTIEDAGPGFSVTRPDLMETKVLSPIDNDAAVVLKALVEKGPNGLTAEQREQWALFISSLLQRHPQHINERDVLAQQLVRETLQEFREKWGPPPAGRRDVLASLDIARVARYTYRAHLTNTIREPKLVKYLSDLSGVTITLPTDFAVKLVTGDNPVVVNMGQPGAIECYSLSLRPNVLLFCQNSTEPLDDEELILGLVRAQNVLLIKQCEFIFSREVLADNPPIRMRKCALDALRKVSVWPRNQGTPPRHER